MIMIHWTLKMLLPKTTKLPQDAFVFFRYQRTKHQEVETDFLPAGTH